MYILKNSFLSIFILAVLLISCGSNSQVDGNLLYLGQTPPGNIPELFAPGVISSDASEVCIYFSPDQKEIFITRRDAPEDAKNPGEYNRIMYLELKNGSWTEPALAPFAMECGELEATVSPDGERIYFGSSRAKPDDTGKEGEIWISRRADNGWSEAEYLDTPVNDGFAMYVTESNDKSLFYTGFVNGKFGIHVSRFENGQNLSPEFLPDQINSLPGAAHPYIAPDESYILFDAQPEGGGKTSLYVSFKLANSTWSESIKLDESINSTNSEMCPIISPDGKYLFFSRAEDIFWVDAKVVFDLNPKSNN